MILLYLIGIFCSLVLFAPSIVPGFVKWPIALLVVLVVVFFFNVCKKDTIYITHDTKKKLHNYGLFNPLIMYVAASIYLLGFTLIITNLQQNNINDIVAQFSDIINLVKPDFSNSLFCGLIFVVSSFLIYFIRNSFKNNASESSLKFRAFWYVLLTLIALLVGVFNLDSFANFDLYAYLENGYNIYVFFGLAGLVILIDLLVKLIVFSVRRSKAKKLANADKPVVVKPVKRTKKATFLGTLLKLVVTAGFFVGAMYLLDTYYPKYAEIAELEPLYFGIIFAFVLYVLHLTDLMRIWIFRRACKAKRSRFLLFIYYLLVLSGLSNFISLVSFALQAILGVSSFTLGTFDVQFWYVGVALLVIQFFVIAITVTSKARHRYLAAKHGYLIGEEVVKEKKVKEKKVKKAKKYKKPSLLGFIIKLVLLALLYVGGYFALTYFVPDFNLFDNYLGYVIIAVLVYLLIVDTIRLGVIYRAGCGKTSKFLIFLYSLLMIIYIAAIVFSLHYYLGLYFTMDNTYFIVICAAFVFSLICSIVGLISQEKKIRRKALEVMEAEVLEETPVEVNEEAVVEEVVEEKPLSKKELKLAKKQAKKEAKLAKKEAKKAKIVEKERKRIEKKLAKKEAKIDKKIAKLEKKLAKKQAKADKKAAKKAAKLAKKNPPVAEESPVEENPVDSSNE